MAGLIAVNNKIIIMGYVMVWRYDKVKTNVNK